MGCGEHAAVTIADVLRDHVAGLHLSPEQAKVVAHILACRTGRLGGHVAVCDHCGYKHFAYHSCRETRRRRLRFSRSGIHSREGA